MIIKRLETLKDFNAASAVLVENGMKTCLAPVQFGAFVDEKLVATSGLVSIIERQRASGWLASVAVSKPFKRKGFGSAVVQAAVDIARCHNFRSVWLETYFWNTAFYERNGFVGIISDKVADEIKAHRSGKHCRFMMFDLASEV